MLITGSPVLCAAMSSRVASTGGSGCMGDVKRRNLIEEQWFEYV